MDLQLRHKTAALSGASKGIGRAAARVLAAEGCNLVLAARNGAELESLAAELRRENRVHVATCAADLATSAGQQAFADAMGEVDILVNCAGANPPGDIEEVCEEVWRASWELKVFGYVNLTRIVYARMKRRGSGTIVNIIGNSADRMNDRYILGSTGNLALAGLTRALGARSPDFGVRVVGIHPGGTATERVDVLLRGFSRSKYGTADRTEDILRDMKLPFGRLCDPSEIADAVAFLASPRAGYISGTVLTVDGGATNRHD